MQAGLCCFTDNWRIIVKGPRVHTPPSALGVDTSACLDVGNSVNSSLNTTCDVSQVGVCILVLAPVLAVSCGSIHYHQ